MGNGHNYSHKIWQEALSLASHKVATPVPHYLEAYLVEMLIRHTQTSALNAKPCFTLEFFQALNAANQIQRLQNVGDVCLIYAGLFPGHAEKKALNVKYFVELGQSAYGLISRTTGDIFALLAQKFVLLMDILQSMRPASGLSLLQLFSQWEKLQSRAAYNELTLRGAIPISHLQLFKK